MAALEITIVVTQVLATLSLIYYLYFVARILCHFKKFKNSFYICVLSMSVSGITHLLFSAADFWNYVLYTGPVVFWITSYLDNFTAYAETFNMVHLAGCRFVAAYFPVHFEKVSNMTTTLILIGVSWAVGLIGACMEPVLWHMKFNYTIGWNTVEEWHVERAFTIGEQAYIYGCVLICLAIHMAVAVSLRMRSKKITGGKSEAKREQKILIQSFLITIVYSSARAMVILLQFSTSDEQHYILTCCWTIFTYAHHALNPVICTVMSAEVQTLLFFWTSKAENKVISVQHTTKAISSDK